MRLKMHKVKSESARVRITAGHRTSQFPTVAAAAVYLPDVFLKRDKQSHKMLTFF